MFRLDFEEIKFQTINCNQALNLIFYMYLETLENK